MNGTKPLDLDSVIKEAKDFGGYLVTITTQDKSKEENNLKHYVFRQEFSVEDILPSLDACVRSMNIRPSQPPPKVVLLPVEKAMGEDEMAGAMGVERRPLKVAILTHFNRAPDSYSPGQAVRAQVRTLQEHGHEVVLFTAEGATLDFGCEKRCVVPGFKRQKNVVNEEIKDKFIGILRTELTGFDVVITQDIMYIDDCVTYRQAILECAVPVKWLHWARSGRGTPIDIKMSNAKYVYMNYTDAGRFAQSIGVKPEDVRVVFNEKDISKLLKWHTITKELDKKYNFASRDVMQVYPLCSTRMDAKGINHVIKTFGKLKELGNKVLLIIANSNGRKRAEEIESKIEIGKEYGLNSDELVFTSKHSEETLTQIPHEVVMNLMGVANLMIFPTMAEVCSNVQLESGISKQLLVVNLDFPSLMDFCDPKSVLGAHFSSRISLNYTDRDDESYMSLARQIHGELRSNKADRQFRHVWRNHSSEAVYKQLEAILYE